MTSCEPCPLTTALEAIGGRWNLIVLYWLAQGTRRFNELQRLAPPISHKVLTSTLRQLESNRLVERTVYPEVPPRVEYALSEHGRTVLPVVEAVRSWGHVHLRVQRHALVSTPANFASAADTGGISQDECRS